MEARPLDLLEAVRRGKVSFGAWVEDSYEATRVRLRNKTFRRLEIDFSRSGLVSGAGKSQRIALSHPVGSKPGDYILVLGPRQERGIVFRSLCLDRERAPLDHGAKYDLMPKPLPDFVVDALRQGLGQRDVWEIVRAGGGIRNDDLQVMPPIPAMVDKL